MVASVLISWEIAIRWRCLSVEVLEVSFTVVGFNFLISFEDDSREDGEHSTHTIDILSLILFVVLVLV